ncbi:MAG: Formate dehydrogenase, partial [Methanomicrobiales archaeon 53_19]
VDGAVKAGALETGAADEKGIAIRAKVENSMLKLGEKWRKKDFEGLGIGRARLETIMKETSRCIKCYACIENCPICYCVECSTRKPHLVTPGQVPPGPMFHMIRFAHISDSCINCGQCEELCAMDIPNALFMHAQQVELEKMFGFTPGVNMAPPVLAYAEEKVERKRLDDTGSDQIFDNVFKE